MSAVYHFTVERRSCRAYLPKATYRRQRNGAVSACRKCGRLYRVVGAGPDCPKMWEWTSVTAEALGVKP